MSQREAVLFANEAFYCAFANRDLDAMDEAWAHDAPVSCIHPGWHPLTCREDVIDTWKSILTNPETPDIVCVNVDVHLHDAMAIVTCHEEIDGQFLSATNVLVQEHGRWVMVHHQAGPVATPPEEVEDNAGDATSGVMN